MTPRRRLAKWLDERAGLTALMGVALDEPVPGGARFAYVFGSAAFLLMIMQIATGIGLALYYSPSANNAWSSVWYVQTQVWLGWLLRGLHYYGASAIVIVVGMHALQVVLFGAYKAPREAVWLSGLCLAALLFGFALTGYLLPWDQKGYWATRVATSIAGTAPGVGGGLQRLAQGGAEYGTLTLTRFYAMHVVVLPLAFVTFVGLHVLLFRRHGVTAPDRVAEAHAAKQAKVDAFWPRQVAYDAVFALLVVAAIALVAVRTHGAPLEAPADPTQAPLPRPEWYFLALFQLLKYFEGPLEAVGTQVVPALLAAFLVALPFLDRRPGRDWRKRKPFVALVALGLAGYAGLTFAAVRADAKDPTIAGRKRAAEEAARRAMELAAQGIPPEGATLMVANDPLVRGQRIFDSQCRACHAVNGEGEKKAPDLGGYLSAAWIAQVVDDPGAPHLYGMVHKLANKMDPYGKKLKQPDIEAVAGYLAAFRAGDEDKPEHGAGKEIFGEVGCDSCHEVDPNKPNDGPNFHGLGTDVWLSELIEDPGSPIFYGANNAMPAFRDKLSPADLKAVVTYVASLSGTPPIAAK